MTALQDWATKINNAFLHFAAIVQNRDSGLKGNACFYFVLSQRSAGHRNPV
jgi:hypothetical protein